VFKYSNNYEAQPLAEASV